MCIDQEERLFCSICAKRRSFAQTSVFLKLVGFPSKWPRCKNGQWKKKNQHNPALYNGQLVRNVQFSQTTMAAVIQQGETGLHYILFLTLVAAEY